MPPKTNNFETARTRKFRASELCQEDEGTISDIEEFGCSVVNVVTEHGLGWSSTIGVFDTSGKPEIITVRDYFYPGKVLFHKLHRAIL